MLLACPPLPAVVLTVLSCVAGSARVRSAMAHCQARRRLMDFGQHIPDPRLRARSLSIIKVRGWGGRGRGVAAAGGRAAPERQPCCKLDRAAPLPGAGLNNRTSTRLVVMPAVIAPGACTGRRPRRPRLEANLSHLSTLLMQILHKQEALESHVAGSWYFGGASDPPSSPPSY